MLIIGERINTSRPDIKSAVSNRDSAFILNEVKQQMYSGAAMIDVNCGTSMEKESDDMAWLIKTIQDSCDIALCIDSPSADVLKNALRIHKGRAMINSITAEKSRYEKILPFCRDSDCLIVALVMDEKGIPDTARQRFEIATIIMEICREYGISPKRIYFDPLIRPISTESSQAKEVLDAIRLMNELELQTIAGLSNISFGLPNRRLINRTFLAMAYAYGLDACIIDPSDAAIMSCIKASSALLGHDQYSMDYISAYREHKLVK